MERLRGGKVNENIHTAMEAWLEAIKKVQCRRRDELINANNRHQDMMAGIETYRVQEDKGKINYTSFFFFLTNDF
mgnify:FL=1